MASERFAKAERQVRDAFGGGMSVLTQGEMRRRFSGAMPRCLMPLVEKLQKLDPKTDEYRQALSSYIGMSRRI